jgi:secreted trypsin-like serine protease
MAPLQCTGQLVWASANGVTETVLHVRRVDVTSFGKFHGCKNFLAVYTRVSSYIPWIESVVGKRRMSVEISRRKLKKPFEINEQRIF